MMILASQSMSRRSMLEAAGVSFTAERSGVDEDAAKAALAGTLDARDLADALAELKALKVSQRRPDALVLGSDSLVELADGTLLDKPESREQACEHLERMSGGVHRLWSAAVIAVDGVAVWRHVDGARLHVRTLSVEFIQAYLDREWPAISGCVGCFRIEGAGVQLFDRIEGSHFTVLGMPLLPILRYLRQRSVTSA